MGVERQEAECRALAEAHGWAIAGEPYIDNYRSASKKTVQRPAYARMLADVRSGKHDGILAWDMDRLTRQLGQLADLMDLAQETQALIGIVSGQIGLSTAQGEFMATVMGGVARQEVRHKGPTPVVWSVVEAEPYESVRVDLSSLFEEVA